MSRPRELKVSALYPDEGVEFVVAYTDDEAAARAAVIPDLAQYLEEVGEVEFGDLAAAVTAATKRAEDLRPRVGYYRWNPCHESSCFDGGGHRSHLGYAAGPGRGNFRGIYLQAP